MSLKTFYYRLMPRELKHLPIESLQPGQYQPRQDFNELSLQELAESIISQGLIEPLIVREIALGCYEIIAGERRWRAAQKAGLKLIPCLVGEYTDQQACAVTLIENIQRQDLNLIEEAQGYQRLITEFHFHQNEIALWVGKSRSHIANILRLLSLSTLVKKWLSEGNLTLGHARALVGLPEPLQKTLAEQTIREEWSVRYLEQKVKSCKTDLSTSVKNPKNDRDVERLQSILSEQLGTPVQIAEDGEKGGWLKVKFFDNDTLAGLLDRFGLSYD
ncbi:chromosome partitioning protein ParB [Legionella israelensis]|uniref:Probable chromosome-partitioning protein ParB n=2 Tax=Legionella israelensis TaxID=454 RepID=A0A0W0WQC7_9GAMM|nr:ParB/RepB/Spo0J family partition protein [Legionella israelensis]KTD34546.1 chromosome partitioning protein ParB [Legionella israelensis]SCX98793.1 chromosome partitioning protein, ParB family [Legionella israelensis DSM 19235]STX58967.1 chromosome partitioning protein ParB [Legionella israelensis]